MNLKERLREIGNKYEVDCDIFIPDILKAVRESLPKIKEEFKMTYGGCNPDRNRGYNDAIEDMEERMK